MNGISTFLWFDGAAEEAARFYVDVFPDSRITGGDVFEDPRPEGPGAVSLVSFELAGRPFTALNGGPMFAFTPAISFVIGCEDQAEVDYYWQRLTEGGQESQCGWCRDRFGVSWQVVPSDIQELLAAGAWPTLMPMTRIDIGALRTAAGRN